MLTFRSPGGSFGFLALRLPDAAAWLGECRGVSAAAWVLLLEICRLNVAQVHFDIVTEWMNPSRMWPRAHCMTVGQCMWLRECCLWMSKLLAFQNQNTWKSDILGSSWYNKLQSMGNCNKSWTNCKRFWHTQFGSNEKILGVKPSLAKELCIILCVDWQGNTLQQAVSWRHDAPWLEIMVPPSLWHHWPNVHNMPVSFKSLALTSVPCLPQSLSGCCPQLHWTDAFFRNTIATRHFSGLQGYNPIE